jgi:predicted MPP superfamily phosphohydrolase
MIIAIVLFFFAILFICHRIVYEFFIRAFGVERKRIKIIVALILAFLFFGFIISSILVRWRENGLTRFLYFGSALWLGMIINLFLALVAAFFITIIFRFFGRKANLKFLSVVVIIFVFSYSLFGVWNVFNPRIKNITVKIKDIPKEWQGKTIVQISDVHLGSALGENFLKDVVNKINSVNPEIVVITGDLLDGSSGSVPFYIKLLEGINTVQGVYYITGNHEVYFGVEKALFDLNKINIKILEDEIVDLGGLQVIGISYPKFNETKNIKNIIQANTKFVQEKPSLLLFHSPTSINHTEDEKEDRHKNMYWTPNTDFSDVKDLGIDLQLSGHTHNGQIFPFGFVTKFIYNGYDYGLHQDGDFAIYISSGVGVWGPPMRTGSRSEIVAIRLESL